MIKRYFHKLIYELRIDYLILYLKSIFIKKTYKYSGVKVYNKKGMVSIIIPVYNHADFVVNSIESCLNQTYKNIEIIVIDDGSTDNLQEVLKIYKNNKKIKIYKTKNQGLPKALNTGFQFATGEFHTWTSADNSYKKGAIAEMVRFLRVRPDVQMTYTNYTAAYNNAKLFREYGESRKKVFLPNNTKDLNVKNMIGACFLWKAIASRVLGEWCLDMGIEDYDYWMRMNAIFKIKRVNTNKSYYIYNYHDNSMTGNHIRLGIKEKADKLRVIDKKRNKYYNIKFKFYSDHNFNFCNDIFSFDDKQQEKTIFIITSQDNIEKYKKYKDGEFIYIFFYDLDKLQEFAHFNDIDCFFTANNQSKVLEQNKRNSFYVNNLDENKKLLENIANNELFFRRQYTKKDRKLNEVKAIL